MTCHRGQAKINPVPICLETEDTKQFRLVSLAEDHYACHLSMIPRLTLCLSLFLSLCLSLSLSLSNISFCVLVCMLLSLLLYHPLSLRLSTKICSKRQFGSQLGQSPESLIDRKIELSPIFLLGAKDSQL